MSTAAVPVRRLPLAIPVAVALAWAAALAAEASGASALVHHDDLLEGGPPVWAALGITVLTWPVMVTAMMLPSSVPMVRLFATVSVTQARRGRVLAAFLAGYALVWTAFGVAALLGDAAVHATVERVDWLHEREWLVGAAILGLAGAFQFSNLKEACLEQCRHPAAFLMPRYRRGQGAAFRIGLSHGLFCLGCCWALMLVLFAAGVGELLWMAALTAVMVAEKVGWGRRWLSPAIGMTLLAWAVVVAANPPWLPGALSGA